MREAALQNLAISLQLVQQLERVMFGRKRGRRLIAHTILHRLGFGVLLFSGSGRAGGGRCGGNRRALQHLRELLQNHLALRVAHIALGAGALQQAANHIHCLQQQVGHLRREGALFFA